MGHVTSLYGRRDLRACTGPVGIRYTEAVLNAGCGAPRTKIAQRLMPGVLGHVRKESVNRRHVGRTKLRHLAVL